MGEGAGLGLVLEAGDLPTLFGEDQARYLVAVAEGDLGTLQAAAKAAGVPVAFKTYGGMGHSACPAELSDVAAFLSERLPPV